jgi:tryptophan synthase alpha chain
MTRIQKLFETKPRGVLNVYCTAGFPEADSTIHVLQSLQDAGADMVEIGMPYSDPLADGPVIQASGTTALQKGMTIHRLFEQLKSLRPAIDLPVILMGYLNPVLQFGFEAFCKTAAALGVDGLIIPDLPILEFEEEYGPIIKKCGLDFIFLITPETSDERIQKIDELSSGFVYAVSSSSTTGKDKNFNSLEDYFSRLKSLHLQNPVMVGFGIKDKASFDAVTPYAAGAIIGTAYIKAISNSSDISKTTKEFIEAIRN